MQKKRMIQQDYNKSKKKQLAGSLKEKYSTCQPSVMEACRTLGLSLNDDQNDHIYLQESMPLYSVQKERALNLGISPSGRMELISNEAPDGQVKESNWKKHSYTSHQQQPKLSGDHHTVQQGQQLCWNYTIERKFEEQHLSGKVPFQAKARTLILFFLILFTYPYFVKGRGFKMDLIHRASPLSPYYEPNSTLEDFWSSAIESDKLRFSFFRDEDPFFPTIPVHASSAPLYVLNFSMGLSPSQPVYLTFDTGSSLIWVQSLPCIKCYDQNYPYYDYRKSGTYRRLPCPRCLSFFSNTAVSTSCNRGECIYFVGYYSFESAGVIGTDFLSFGAQNPSAGSLVLPFVLAFSVKNTGTLPRDIMGIAGFSRTNVSLINQLGEFGGRKFSYCFLPFGYYKTSSIMFGDEAVFHGIPTPLQDGAKYVVNLLDISVDGERLHTPPGTFFSKEYEKGAIIDSGSTATYLNVFGFDLLREKLVEVITLREAHECNDTLCFYGDSEDMFEGLFPSITFHFEGGLNVTLPPEIAFRHKSHVVMELTMRPSINKLGGTSVFGAAFQQNLLVGFDLVKKMAYMAPIDCSIFI